MTEQKKTANRWLVAIMGTVLQICLGTIYAWSFFQNPLMAYAGWTNQQVAWILSLAICFLGLSAAVGGTLLPKFGPRKLAITGILLYALGWVIGGMALGMKSLPLLYIGMGAIGGIGLGLGYVTPVATAAKWFPDKKGFITGMVVMGFGLGALLMSKVIAPVFVDAFTTTPAGGGDPVTAWPSVFYFIALALGVPGLIAASIMQNPRGGLRSRRLEALRGRIRSQCNDPRPAPPVRSLEEVRPDVGHLLLQHHGRDHVHRLPVPPAPGPWLKLEDPGMAPAALAAAGATLIGVSSLFNGIGRFFWGGISDKIGRTQTFTLHSRNPDPGLCRACLHQEPHALRVFVCYILLCYGGGFGNSALVRDDRVRQQGHGGCLRLPAHGVVDGRHSRTRRSRHASRTPSPPIP